MTGLLDVVGLVVSALDRLEVPYTIGGSLASSFAGEPRASIDADILVAITSAQVEPFVSMLGDAFYADVDALHRAVAHGASANVIHRGSGIKVDLFIPRSRLDHLQLERRRRVAIGAERSWYVHSPEDILLQKLFWYRQGGEVSDRQWRDVLGILLAQGERLDFAYLNTVAHPLGLADLLDRARREATPGR